MRVRVKIGEFMPVRVRLKIIAAIAIALAIIGVVFFYQPILGVALLVLTLLYIEMLYPNWNFFSSAISNVRDRGANAVAVTFDDGPSEWTPSILETLKKEKAVATFFLLGKNVERHPEIARRIQAEGHTIGYHGYSHTKFHHKGPRFIREDLDRCIEAFERAGLSRSELIRFPHGVKNFLAIREVKRRGLKLCVWGRGVWDSKRPGVEKILARSKELQVGEILLLHDGDGIKENPDRSQTAEALPEILRYLKSEKKVEFVTLK